MQANTFKHRIDKEQVNQMPLDEFPGQVIVVKHEWQVMPAINYLQQQSVVGVDTETRPSFVHGQHYPTALVQIATAERCYLFQLKHIHFTQSLANFFSNAEVCKVGLAFKDDLRGLQRLRQFEPRNCIDLQRIALEWGILEMGLQKMYAIVFGKKISKSQQLTNWDNIVLTDEQARYASTDAWATLMIYNQLLQTKRLRKAEWQQLRADDLQRQLEHQQQVQAQRLLEHSESNQNSNLSV